MGVNKALIELGGVRLIDRLVETLRAVFDPVAIVANHPDAYAHLEVPVWSDRIPGRGALGGIYTAVLASSSAHTFCIACDMPFPDPGVIAHIRDLAPGHDVVVPRTADGYHPLHAVYGKTCLPHLEDMMRANRLRIDRLFAEVRTRTIGEEELSSLGASVRCLTNINTPGDLKAAARLFDGAPPASSG
jgi:molybdopterin-guanine dinucleotide biosynthesis protein A